MEEISDEWTDVHVYTVTDKGSDEHNIVPTGKQQRQTINKRNGQTGREHIQQFTDIYVKH